MAATVHDVARMAGVSASTVSRVINSDPRISEETRRKVLACIEVLAYRVNGVARSLKTNRTRTVGFITPEIANGFFMLVAKGVETALREENYSLIICNSDESASEEAGRIRLLLDRRVDGLIVIPATAEGAHFRVLQAAGVPLVLVDRLTDDFSSDAVLVDNYEGSRRAAAYLLSRGDRRVGFIGGDMKLTSARERYEGFLAAFGEMGYAPEAGLVRFGDFHAESGYRIMKEFLELPSPPERIFIANYYMNVGANRCLLEYRRVLPPGLILAGFDDMELTPLLGFQRVTVAQPIMEIGRAAADLIMKRIRAEDLPFPEIRRLHTTLLVQDG